MANRRVYNIIKWIVFLLIIGTGISFFCHETVKVFFIFSIICFVGPRLENSMDTFYCGKEIACHKVSIWDIVALCFIILEIIVDFSVDFSKTCLN